MTPLEGLIDKSNKDVYINHQLQQVKNNSNRLLKLVNELMDFRKMQFGKIQLRVKETDLLAVVKNVTSYYEEDWLVTDGSRLLRLRGQPTSE